MQIDVLGCHGGQAGSKFSQISYLINESTLIDAGSATRMSLDRQKKIRNVIISHTHLDHVKDLGFLADNLLGKVDQPIVMHTLPENIEILQKHYFNSLIWPDFTAIPKPEDAILVFKEIALDKPFTIDGVKFLPFKAVHPVPALGLTATDKNGSIVFSCDTGVNDQLWANAKKAKKLKSMIVECSFPNRLSKLADISGHLTPKMLVEGLRGFGNKDIDYHICHMKPEAEDLIRKELQPAVKDGFNIKLLAQDDQILI